VAAHIFGDELARMIEVFPTDPATARQIHWRLLPVFEALFIEPSPAPLKAALTMLGLPAGSLRLPMVPISQSTYTTLRDAMADAGLNVNCEDS
jgi:4-hydroxy-tetrahydrodipicolinate synthase